MGDHQHGHVIAPHCRDRLRHLPHRVDVEARVDLVQHHHPGFEHGHLEDFGALLLPSRQVPIDRPIQEPFHAESPSLGGYPVRGVLGRGSEGYRCLFHENGQIQTWYLHRVLKGLKQSGPGPLVDAHVGDRSTIHHDRSGHLVPGLAGQDVAEGGLAGAVRAHDGVHLAEGHGEIDAFQDVQTSHRGLETFHPERGSPHRCPRSCSNPTNTAPASTRTENAGTGRVAGSEPGRPVRTSNSEP